MITVFVTLMFSIICGCLLSISSFVFAAVDFYHDEKLGNNRIAYTVENINDLMLLTRYPSQIEGLTHSSSGGGSMDWRTLKNQLHNLEVCSRWLIESIPELYERYPFYEITEADAVLNNEICRHVPKPPFSSIIAHEIKLYRKFSQNSPSRVIYEVVNNLSGRNDRLIFLEVQSTKTEISLAELCRFLRSLPWNAFAAYSALSIRLDRCRADIRELGQSIDSELGKFANKLFADTESRLEKLASTLEKMIPAENQDHFFAQFDQIPISDETRLIYREMEHLSNSVSAFDRLEWLIAREANKTTTISVNQQNLLGKMLFKRPKPPAKSKPLRSCDKKKEGNIFEMQDELFNEWLTMNNDDNKSRQYSAEHDLPPHADESTHEESSLLSPPDGDQSFDRLEWLIAREANKTTTISVNRQNLLGKMLFKRPKPPAKSKPLRSFDKKKVGNIYEMQDELFNEWLTMNNDDNKSRQYSAEHDLPPHADESTHEESSLLSPPDGDQSFEHFLPKSELSFNRSFTKKPIRRPNSLPFGRVSRRKQQLILPGDENFTYFPPDTDEFISGKKSKLTFSRSNFAIYLASALLLPAAIGGGAGFIANKFIAKKMSPLYRNASNLLFQSNKSPTSVSPKNESRNSRSTIEITTRSHSFGVAHIVFWTSFAIIIFILGVYFVKNQRKKMFYKVNTSNSSSRNQNGGAKAAIEVEKSETTFSGSYKTATAKTD